MNKFYPIGGKVIVNATVKLEESPITRSSKVKGELQAQMIRVIQQNSNRIGGGNLYVEGPLNPIPGMEGKTFCLTRIDITLIP